MVSAFIDNGYHKNKDQIWVKYYS
uniref:Uncharacterized protein n=1 Tax=Anguilla anguilla TaxID=7936 RepID=A0A0E9RFX3_ANGAN